MDVGRQQGSTHLLKTDLTEILMGMLAMVSPPSGMFGSMTWQRRMGWSFTVTSWLERNTTETWAGRSTGLMVPRAGVTENILHTSSGQPSVGSNMNLKKQDYLTLEGI